MARLQRLDVTSVWVASVVSIAIASACQTAAPLPPPPPPPIVVAPTAPPPDPCAPSASACQARAELLADDDAKAATALLELCIQCSRPPAAAFRLLASLTLEADDSAAARRALQRGVKAHPDSAPLWLALARLENAEGAPRESMAALGRARALRPNDETIASEYRTLLARVGTKEERLEVELEPLLAEANGRFELDDSKGALDALSTALRRAIGVARVEANVRHRMALVHLSSGAHAAALAHLERALALEPRPTKMRAAMLVTRAETWVGLGRAHEAVADSDAALVIDPDNALAYANLAVARASSGEDELAVDALKLAFARGLARHVTRDQLLAIEPLARLNRAHQLDALLADAWPSASR